MLRTRMLLVFNYPYGSKPSLNLVTYIISWKFPILLEEKWLWKDSFFIWPTSGYPHGSRPSFDALMCIVVCGCLWENWNCDDTIRCLFELSLVQLHMAVFPVLKYTVVLSSVKSSWASMVGSRHLLMFVLSVHVQTFLRPFLDAVICHCCPDISWNWRRSIVW